MKLKAQIDYAAFLKQVRLCAGDVQYMTVGGDCLNLKSLLSEYVLLSAAMGSDLIRGGEVRCSLAADYEILTDYLAGDD